VVGGGVGGGVVLGVWVEGWGGWGGVLSGGGSPSSRLQRGPRGFIYGNLESAKSQAAGAQSGTKEKMKEMTCLDLQTSRTGKKGRKGKEYPYGL